jgi:hypothetical protein
MTIKNLIKLIKKHGHDAYEYDGIIIATSEGVRNGKTVEISERVEPNANDVLIWLGY